MKTLEERVDEIDPAELETRLKRIRDVVSQCLTPPGTSAQNVEVLCMSFAVYLISLQEICWNGVRIPDSAFRLATDPFMRRFHAAAPRLFDNLHSSVILGDVELATDDMLPEQQAKILADSFLGRWKASAFARLEVSHKLAAALCLTDIVDSDDLRAPWAAWSLIVPNGLFGESAPARVWCSGKTPVVLVFQSGLILGWSDENAGGRTQSGMLRSLILGACASLSAPDRAKRSGRWGASAQRKHRRHGGPPEGSRYILAQPVSIDLRDTVRETLGRGHRKGASPKVQFLVRGHWRNQAHGPGRAMRTFKWIEPFWKGPKDTRVLLRPHKIKKE